MAARVSSAALWCRVSQHSGPLQRVLCNTGDDSARFHLHMWLLGAGLTLTPGTTTVREE